jgi:hypothetical protein
MADRGAKHLILLSRLGPQINASKDLCEELQEQDVQVKTLACDVTDLMQMRETFAQLCADMPPIKGVCQMSIVGRVSKNSNISLPRNSFNNYLFRTIFLRIWTMKVRMSLSTVNRSDPGIFTPFFPPGWTSSLYFPQFPDSLKSAVKRTMTRGIHMGMLVNVTEYPKERNASRLIWVPCLTTVF